MVVEYAAEQPLQRYCSPESLPPMERVVEIAFKASQALDHASRKGVIHCDVKPASILLAGETGAKVSDFGAARYDRADHICLNGMGSPDYMSPKQVLDKPLSHETDIHSLGVVLYQLLTGRLPFEGSSRGSLPFEGSSRGSLTYELSHLDPLPPSLHRRDLPGPLERIVLPAPAKNPRSRYATWNDMSRDLARAVKHLALPVGAMPEA